MGLEENKDEIHKAFIVYVELVSDALTRPASLKESMVDDSIRLAYIDPGLRLRSLVEKLEASEEFDNLRSAIDRAVDSGARKIPSTGIRYYSIYSLSLPNFFRRSHFYSDASEGLKANPEEVFESFWASLVHRKVRTARLRLLDRVWFTSKTLDFGIFRIQKFTKDELDELIDSEIREVFYRETRLNTEFVSQYWFIVEENLTEHGLAIKGKIPWAPLAVQRNLPDRVIQLLSLYEWTPDWVREDFDGEDRFWMGFRVPFSFRVSDDVFGRPTFIPVVPNLDQVLPEVGGGPEFPIQLGRQEEAELVNVVEKGKKALEIIFQLKAEWNFVEIAMGYLAKAFLTNDDLDQILWHVGVLDALLSEENAGVRQVMRPRIGNILGSTENEKKEIRKRFDELYEFRSDVVHGKEYTEKAQSRHLADARELARQSLFWFIDYLLLVDENLRKQGIDFGQYPRRGELLSVLDFDKTSLNRLNSLIGSLPSDFPRIQK